jgi:histidinol-phosphate phosphatase family protein
MKRVVFFDKDGTLIEDVPYNCDLTRMRLLPGVAEGLQVLSKAGYRLAVISNQAGVAYGFFTEQFLTAAERRLRALLDDAGVPLDGFYYCPHHPDGKIDTYAVSCECRKPKAGLLRRAAAELGVDLRECWMVGDILDDIEAGRRAGCRTVLIDNGHETEWVWSPDREPHVVATDVRRAADCILSIDEQVHARTGSRKIETESQTHAG